MLQGEHVVISVRDTGIGLSSDAAATVFDMFAQAEAALTRTRGGLGIGLSLVKRLVEMHGGKVTATSPGRGQGSTFTVELPVAARPAPAIAATTQHQDQPGRSLRLLIVDDNRDAADTLAVLLHMLGNETRVVYDGEAAVALAEEYRPDFVLLDIGLPKLDGYGVARRIRQQPWGRETVLIATTGWGQASDREAARDAGFDHHLVKPVDPDAVSAILARGSVH